MWRTSFIRVPTNNSGPVRRGREKAADFFRQMLAVGIENDDVLEAAIEPVAQTGLDRFAFAAILRDGR